MARRGSSEGPVADYPACERLQNGSPTSSIQPSVEFLKAVPFTGLRIDPNTPLRPDIVATNAGNVAFVIDTKWKRLKEQANRDGIATSDVYQMYAYSTQYESPEVLLLYPHHSELGAWKPRRAEYWVNGIQGLHSGGQKVSVATVNLQNLGDVPEAA